MDPFRRSHLDLLVQPRIRHTRVDGPRRTVVQRHHVARALAVGPEPRRECVGLTPLDRQAGLVEVHVHRVGAGLRHRQPATLFPAVFDLAVERPRGFGSGLGFHKELPGLVRGCPAAIPITALQAVLVDIRTVLALVKLRVVDPHGSRSVPEAQVHAAASGIVLRRRKCDVILAPFPVELHHGRGRTPVPPEQHQRHRWSPVHNQRRRPQMLLHLRRQFGSGGCGRSGKSQERGQAQTPRSRDTTTAQRDLAECFHGRNLSRDDTRPSA